MSMRTAVTGLNASQTQLSAIANNLANASTTGFKASRTEFADLYSADANGTTPGSGVRVAGVTQIMKQGGLEFTGNTLDLAINGNGFFMLRNSEATSYTRAGNFRLNTDGVIVTASGDPLMFYPPTIPRDDQNNSTAMTTSFGVVSTGTPNNPTSIDANQPLRIGEVDYPLTRLDLDRLGVLRATYSNGEIRAIGQVVVATFSTPTNLAQLGDTTWKSTFGSGPAQLDAPAAGDRGTIEAGALEASNVEITEELVDMITAQRNFQANAKMITTADQVAQTVLNIR
jgi:flagellar hook protein FlgE